MNRIWINAIVGIGVVVLLSGIAVPGINAADNPIASLEELQEEIQAVPCNNVERFEAVRKLFTRMGASDSDISVAEFKKVDNLVVTVKGQGEGFIVIGAHYDKSGEGCGAVDNWSGIVILANLYRILRAAKPAKTILFIAYGGEEQRLVGSQAMVDGIPKKERVRYCSMVNLDSFGFAITQVLENVSTPKLTEFVAQVARENKMQYARATIAAESDSEPFRRNGIPAVTLHGMSKHALSIIHTKKDQKEQINPASVYHGYRFVLTLISRLVECDCKAFR